MDDTSGMGQEMTMDATEAAAIMQQAGGRARRRLRPDHRVTFTIWGLLWLLGDGLMWLAVRGQRPFHGPAPAAYAAIVLIAAAASAATLEQVRAESGVRGLSMLRRRIFSLSVLAGFAGAFTLEGALASAGASRAVTGVFEAAVPILVMGLIYLVRSAASQDWPMAGLGIWLIVVAAASGYVGPRTVWAIGALAVGPAFLLTAAVQTWLHRS